MMAIAAASSMCGEIVDYEDSGQAWAAIEISALCASASGDFNAGSMLTCASEERRGSCHA